MKDALQLRRYAVSNLNLRNSSSCFDIGTLVGTGDIYYNIVCLMDRSDRVVHAA